MGTNVQNNRATTVGRVALKFTRMLTDDRGLNQDALCYRQTNKRFVNIHIV